MQCLATFKELSWCDGACSVGFGTVLKWMPCLSIFSWMDFRTRIKIGEVECHAGLLWFRDETLAVII
jgi:hypothetical protein